MAARLSSDNFHLPPSWQLDKSHDECMFDLLRAGKFADVWFQCEDHDKSDKTDTIPAHKLVLASRSPVFEAMFYGDLAESSTIIELPDISKIPFMLFLR